MGEQLLHGAAPVHPHRRFLGRLRTRSRGTGEVVGGLGAMTVVGLLAVLATVALIAGVVAVWPTSGGHNARVAATRAPSGEAVGAPGRADVMAPGAGPLTGRPGDQVRERGRGDDGPVRLGQNAHVGSWDVSLRRTDLRQAPAAGEPSAGELAHGERVLEASLTVTNDGVAPADPGLDLIVGYLGPDGVEYNGDAGGACPTREDVFGHGKITPGETVRGRVCLGVPARAVDGGSWVLRTPEEYARPMVFAAR